MTLQIDRNFFQTRAEVFADIEAEGLWPHTLFSEASPALPLHWHDADIRGYVLQGETWLLDENGERHDFRKGDRLVLPKGTLHAEGETTGPMIYILATPDERPPAVFLQMQAPETRPGDG